MAKRTRRRHKRKNPAPVQFTPNAPRRRRRRRSNPSRPSMRTRTKHVYHRVRRRHNPARGESGGSVSIGSKGSIVDGVLSLGAGGLGYFGGLMFNKFTGGKFIKLRGIALAIAALFGIWKIRDKHARLLFVGAGVEGVVDALRQNVTTFATLSADDAAETLVMGKEAPSISYTHGAPSLGNEAGLGNESGLGEEEIVYGEESARLDDGYENEPPEGYTRALIGADAW